MIGIINDLYNFGSPDLVIDKNKLEEYGIDEDNYNTIDGYKIMVDVIKNRLRGIGVTEDLECLAKENQELKEKLLYMDWDLEDAKNRVTRLEQELEECKSLNSIMSI